MKKLIRLDNGDWIDPFSVESIQALQESKVEDVFCFPRVVVIHGKIHSTIELDVSVDAQKFADELAKEINDSRE